MMKTEARPVCFVTPELHPFSKGGIGRLVHNLIEHCVAEGRTVHAVVADGGPPVAPWSDRVVIHRIAPTASAPNYPEPSGFVHTPHHATSLAVLLKLKELERSGVSFGAIEFTDYLGWGYSTIDYLGWGYSTIQEKRLGLGFEHTTLAVRLHGAASLIQHTERRRLATADVALHELERKSLEDADLVIAPLAPVARQYREFFGFSERWRQAVRVEFPPVLSEGPHRETAPRPVGERDLAFVTKLQAVKRPDLFIRGVAQYLMSEAPTAQRAVLQCVTATGFDASTLRRMVPAELSARVVFDETATVEQRAELLARSIVVIPSDTETLCLTAYEAAAAGATLVLNARCPAFGAETPFVDGLNCHTFDGTVDGLAKALARANTTPLPETVRWRVTPSYLGATPASQARPALKAAPLVSVIVTNHNLAGYLTKTLQNVNEINYPELEVVLVDDASTEPSDRALLEELARDSKRYRFRLKVVRNLVNRGLAASRNIGVSHATGAYVLPLDADDFIDPGFVEIAVKALETSADFDVVVPTGAYFTDESALREHRYVGYLCFLGNTPTLGLLENSFSTATALLRKALFAEVQYDERLTSYEDWSLYLHLTHARKRFLVTNDVRFFYRRRESSMVSHLTASRRSQLLAEIFGTLPRPLPTSVQLAALAPYAEDPPPPPLRHLMVDRLNDRLKRWPAVHGAFKATSGLLKKK